MGSSAPSTPDLWPFLGACLLAILPFAPKVAATWPRSARVIGGTMWMLALWFCVGQMGSDEPLSNFTALAAVAVALGIGLSGFAVIALQSPSKKIL